MSERASIESLLREGRRFDPPAAFAQRAHVGSMADYRALYERSLTDPDGFFGEIARELHWFRPWSRVVDWSPASPFDARWFAGGATNLCFNCVDRQVESGLADRTAIIWEGEPKPGGKPEIRRLTYGDLQRETSRLANALRSLGVQRGDIVTIYMPMVPELAIAMLACARLGAAHSVIFGGFSASAIADRVHDSRSRVILTADGGWRRGKIVPLKDNVDQACAQSGGVEHVVVLKRCGNDVAWHHEPSTTHHGKRDLWWHEVVEGASDSFPCEPMNSEDLLFVLYTSGTTGKPKGIMHATGGYMVWAYLTSKWVFDLHGAQDEVFWCTADCGWVTGHSYVVYGVLPNRVPSVMYEGAPDWPARDRFWEIVARHKVTQFYTAPTAIRAFMKWGDEHPRGHQLESLRVLGTVGEPINPEAWIWYQQVIGGGTCPIVDTWWQTETGGHMISPLPGATPTKPGSCTLPLPGIDAAIVDELGVEAKSNEGGLLAVRRPWPGMLRGILNDRDRYLDTYWSRVKNARGEPYYFAGDGARRDEDGYFWVMGRVDDVINVAGHRLGTMEVESALVSHPAVAEAAVVGIEHEIKGTGIAAFVTLKESNQSAADDALKETLRSHVAREIGAIARPDVVRFTAALPKTRSGKIMRRLLRAIAEGKEQIGDTTTLEDYGVLARLRESEES